MFFLPVLAIACQQNHDFVTESGVEVNCLVKGDEGIAPAKDSVVILQMSIITEGGEVITQTTAERPMAIAYDPAMDAGTLQEVLNKLEKGDSVAFTITAASLYEDTYKSTVPPNMTPETKINVNMKFVEQYSQEGYRAYMMELRQKQQEKELATMAEKTTSDAAEIDAYLAEKGITAVTTESGLRYVITQEGTGEKPQPGDVVVVHYDGKLLSGERFDSSIERGQPFSFPLGQGQVIRGWDEGIGYISKGGKGTLYIPSPLGYGSRGSGPVIKPYSILMFDVEVVDIQKAN